MQDGLETACQYVSDLSEGNGAEQVCVCVFVCFLGETKERRAGPTGSSPCTLVQTHTKKHAPAHLFPLTGEERDGSPQDAPKGGRQVCVKYACVCVCVCRSCRKRSRGKELKFASKVENVCESVYV